MNGPEAVIVGLDASKQRNKYKSSITHTSTRKKKMWAHKKELTYTETEKRHTTKDKDGTKKMERNQRARQTKLIVHQMMAYE